MAKALSGNWQGFFAAGFSREAPFCNLVLFPYVSQVYWALARGVSARIQIIPKMVPVFLQGVLRGCVLVALVLLAPCVQAGGVVVTGAKSPVGALSEDQVRDLYLGHLSSLPDGRNAILLDQPQSSPLRDEFYLKITNRSAAQAKALWAKLYFTGRGTPPREARDSADIKRILNSTPGAIGYIEESALDSSVRVIFVVK